MSKCKCDLRTRLVGDGCAACNPALALEYATEQIDALTRERDEALSLLRRIREDAWAHDMWAGEIDALLAAMAKGA